MDTSEPPYRNDLEDPNRRALVVVERIAKNSCEGCVHRLQSSPWCRNEAAQVFGNSANYYFGCNEGSRMFIEDTPEAWAEYLKARMSQ